MQVKGKKAAAWESFYQPIKGFKYVEGYTYTILVEVSKIENLPDGVFANQYILQKVISKKKTSYNPALKLEAKKWILKTIYDGKLEMAVKDTASYIQLSISESKMTGKAVCNKMFSEVKADGNTIQFGAVSITRMFCGQNDAIFENLITAILQSATTYKIVAGNLTIMAPEGKYLLYK